MNALASVAPSLRGVSLRDGSMRGHGTINSVSVTAVNSLSLAGDAYTGKTIYRNS